MDTPGPPAFSLHRTQIPTNSPPPLSLFFSPLLLLLPGTGRGLGAFFCSPPHPVEVVASRECRVGEPRQGEREHPRGDDAPRVPSSSRAGQHIIPIPSTAPPLPCSSPSFCPVPTVTGGAASSNFSSFQLSKRPLCSARGRHRERETPTPGGFCFPPPFLSAVSKPDTTVFELCKPKYVLKPQKTPAARPGLVLKSPPV